MAGVVKRLRLLDLHDFTSYRSQAVAAVVVDEDVTQLHWPSVLLGYTSVSSSVRSVPH